MELNEGVFCDIITGITIPRQMLKKRCLAAKWIETIPLCSGEREGASYEDNDSENCRAGRRFPWDR